MNLYGIHYNNYFNRIVKKYDSLTDYKELNYAKQADVSFNPNDGCTTDQIVNVATNAAIDWNECDYLVVAEKYSFTASIENTSHAETTAEQRAEMRKQLLDATNMSSAEIYNLLTALNTEPYTGTITKGKSEKALNDLRRASHTPYSTGVANYLERINSRWFIVECQRTRSAQYHLQLKRDVIADNYSAVINNPCYIEKGFVTDDKLGLLLQSEGVQYNQIKRSQQLLKDTLGTYYYVGYVDKDMEETEITVNTNDTAYNSTSDDHFLRASELGGLTTEYPFHYTDHYRICFNIQDNNGGHHRYVLGVSDTDVYKESVTKPNVTPCIRINADVNMDTLVDNLITRFKTNINTLYTHIITAAKALLSGTYEYISATEYKTLMNYAGSIPMLDNWTYGETQDNTLYNYTKVDITNPTDSDWHTKTDTNGLAYYIATEIQAVATEMGKSSTLQDPVRCCFKSVRAIASRFNRTMTERQGQWKINIGSATIHCEDAPYDIIVIPVDCKITYNTQSKRLIRRNQIALAEAINAAGTSGEWLKDMQRVPYAPIYNEKYVEKEVGSIDGLLNMDRAISEHKAIAGNPTAAGSTALPVFMLYATTKNADDTKSTTDLQLYSTLWARSIDNEYTPRDLYNDIDKYKLSLDCDLIRIMSPNGNGAFDFNMAKNGGTCDSYKIECTFRPQKPYIHVAPNFKGLYGQTFGDYRGLICGGDFSIATMKDAWLNYMANNKNYQIAFDRDIQNLDFNQRYQKIEQGIGAATSAISTGVGAGIKTGNPYLGIAAGAASGAGGAADAVILSDKQKEIRDYQIDRFNLNLRNIQALPGTVTKIGSDDINNKIWPYLEFYSCRDEEKKAFDKKLKYDGYTINAIGIIDDYLNPDDKTFIKGQLIRLEDITDNYKMVTEIYNELLKGVYFE